MEMDGTHLSTYSPRQRREKGLAVVPEGRNTQGLNLLGTVSENLVANRYHIPPFSRYGIIALKEIVRFSRDMIARFDIRADGPDAVAGTLSGGNAQKIIIARELSEMPRVLAVAHPTRGLDIAASEYVRNEILRMRAEKVAVLLISADLEELLAMADRILVLYEGRIVGEVNPEATTYEQLGLLMAGHEAHG
jgi:simple sugar transport system ATP-binding protein